MIKIKETAGKKLLERRSEGVEKQQPNDNNPVYFVIFSVLFFICEKPSTLPIPWFTLTDFSELL